MNKRTLYVVSFQAIHLIFSLLFINLDQAQAQATQIVQIQSPPIEKQQTAVWCWASSIQNGLGSYGINIPQSQIVMTTYGRVINLPIFDPREAAINFFRQNHLVAPQGRVIHPYFVPGAPRPDVLIRELSRERAPLLVFYSNPNGGGHVVVCYGARYSGPPNFPTITEVWVKDPWDAQNKVWQGAQLASLWKSTIFLRVAPRPSPTFMYNGVNYVNTPTYDVINSMTGMVDGRIWYYNETHQWRIIDNFGNDRGAIP
jgi:hypothetical protein